jgi:hypothetical protein
MASGWAKIVRMAAATISAEVLGTLASTTSGAARVREPADGRRFVRWVDEAFDDAPRPRPGNIGDPNFEIPADADPAGYASVVIRPRRSFGTWRDSLPVPFELVHRDERSDEIVAASTGRVPCVLARTAGGVTMLLGPDDLGACVGDVERMAEALARAVDPTASPGPPQRRDGAAGRSRRGHVDRSTRPGVAVLGGVGVEAQRPMAAVR